MVLADIEESRAQVARDEEEVRANEQLQEIKDRICKLEKIIENLK